MKYRRVTPSLWDDDLIVDADDAMRCLWFMLLTGPQVTNLPGLQIATAATLADALRRPIETVSEGLDDLIELGRIDVDERHRVIRIVKAPLHNLPENVNVLRGWWRAWQDIPECLLKYEHIDSLREAAFETYPEEWEKTFGTVPQGFRDRFKTVSKPARTQDPLQDPLQEHIQDTDAPAQPSLLALTAPPSSAPPPTDVDRVWDHYCTRRAEKIGKANEPKLSKTRRSQIACRLKEFSESQLLVAIDTLWSVPWYLENGQTHPEIVFDAMKRVDKLLARAQTNGAKASANLALAGQQGLPSVSALPPKPARRTDTDYELWSPRELLGRKPHFEGDFTEAEDIRRNLIATREGKKILEQSETKAPAQASEQHREAAS